MKRIFLVAALLAAATALVPPGNAAAAQSCNLGNGIKHVVYIQFDNVHFRRDNPNVPSDLEQIPNLLNFLEGNGAFLTNHWTPLISHTSVDILTALTGVYGDKFGIPIGNSSALLQPEWDEQRRGIICVLDRSPRLVRRGSHRYKAAVDRPAGEDTSRAWVAFTRAGCDVGAFSIANIELENTGLDITTVFGANSPEAAEAKSNPIKAATDFEGIAVHCAQNSSVWNLSIHTAPDVRPFPWQSCQWAKSVGFTRRSRSNQSRAPLVLRRNRLNLRRAQRMT